MVRIFKFALVMGVLAAGLSFAWRILRARGAQDVLAAHRDAPHSPDSVSESPPSAAAVADAGWGPVQTRPAAVPAPPFPAATGVPPVFAAAPIVLPAALGPAPRTGPPTEDEIDATLQPRHLRVRGRHYGLKVVAATLAATLLVLVGTGFIAMKMLMGGGSESAESSFEEFAEFGQSGTATTTTLAPGETAPVDTTPGAAATDGAASTGEAAATEAGTDGTGAAAAATLRPADGTYTYAGSGSMETKIFAFSSKTPIANPSTSQVAAAPNGCWSTLSTISGGSAGKTEQLLYCNPGPGALNSPGSQASQKQFGLALTSNVTCQPPVSIVTPGMQPGQSFPANCSVKNTGVLKSDLKMTGTAKYVGLETLDVGGTPVEAYHLYQEQKVSGDVTGVVRSDTWVATSNGLRLKVIRYQEFGGFASQIENSTFVLKSMTPS